MYISEENSKHMNRYVYVRVCIIMILHRRNL